MTAKEKAKELISKFNNSYDEESKTYILYQNIDESKRCALIAVNEILDASLYYFDELSPYVIYWQEVKKEIEKL
jgi:hypothetical protein